MRTFAGAKPLAVLYAQCKAAGVSVDNFNLLSRRWASSISHTVGTAAVNVTFSSSSNS